MSTSPGQATRPRASIFLARFFSAAESEATNLPSRMKMLPAASRLAAGSMTRALLIQRLVMRRNGHEKHAEAQKSDRSFGHEVFFHMENRGAEIDEQAGFDAAGFQVAKKLGNVLVGDSARSLQLNAELDL